MNQGIFGFPQGSDQQFRARSIITLGSVAPTPGAVTRTLLIPAWVDLFRIILIGGGGGADSTGLADQLAGTASSFASYFSAAGGAGSDAAGAGGTGGTGSGGDLNITGSYRSQVTTPTPKFLYIPPEFGVGGFYTYPGGAGGVSVRTFSANVVGRTFSITLGVGGAGSSGSAVSATGSNGAIILDY